MTKATTTKCLQCDLPVDLTNLNPHSLPVPDENETNSWYAEHALCNHIAQGGTTESFPEGDDPKAAWITEC